MRSSLLCCGQLRSKIRKGRVTHNSSIAVPVQAWQGVARWGVTEGKRLSRLARIALERATLGGCRTLSQIVCTSTSRGDALADPGKAGAGCLAFGALKDDGM